MDAAPFQTRVDVETAAPGEPPIGRPVDGVEFAEFLRRVRQLVEHGVPAEEEGGVEALVVIAHVRPVVRRALLEPLMDEVVVGRLVEPASGPRAEAHAGGLSVCELRPCRSAESGPVVARRGPA